MARQDILVDLNHSYYVEKMQSTLCGRIDRALSFIIVFLGASVFGDFFHASIYYGILIAFIATLNGIYQFGKKSAQAKDRAYQYLVLIRDADSEKLSDIELSEKFKKLEKHDSDVFSILCNAAQQRATIVLGLRDNPAIKLTRLEKIVSWLAGNLPNQSEYLKNNTGPYPDPTIESDN